MRRSSEHKNDLMWNVLVYHSYRIREKKYAMRDAGMTESEIAEALDMSILELRLWCNICATDQVEMRNMMLMHKRELEKEEAFEEDQGS